MEEDDLDIDDINDQLDLISGQTFTTPSIAFERAKHLLDSLGIIVPENKFLPPNESTEIFPLEGNEELYVYFSYNLTDYGLYEVDCQIIDKETLDDITNEADTIEHIDESLNEDFSRGVKQISRPAAKQAKAMGLIYLGFGRYGDRNHTVKYIVKNNRLIPVLDKTAYHIPDTTIGKKASLEYDMKWNKSNINAYLQHTDNKENPTKQDFIDYKFKNSYDSNEKYKTNAEDDGTQYYNQHLYYTNKLKDGQVELDAIEAKEKEEADKNKISIEEIDPEALDKHHEEIQKILDQSREKAKKTLEKFNNVYSKHNIENKLSKEELRIVKDYTGSFSRQAISHAVLRKDNPEEYKRQLDAALSAKEKGYDYEHDVITSVEKKMKQLDDAIEAIPIPEDCTVYSGLRNPFEKAENFKRGEKVHFSGYLSTSLDYTTATNFSDSAKRLGTEKYTRMVIQIKARKGQSGLYVDNISSNAGEEEMILPRDTVFRVVAEPQVVKAIHPGGSDTVIIPVEIYEQN